MVMNGLKDVPEIIEFFDNHKTKESLKELEMWKLSSVQKNESSKNRKSNKDKIPLINVSVNIILKGEIDRKRIKELERYLWYRLDSFWDVIREEFGEYEEEIRRGIEALGNELVDVDEYEKMRREYQYLLENFDNDNVFARRMKMLCDINKRYPKFFSIYGPYLQFIPLQYQNYINLIGFEAIGSMKYQEADIIRFIENKDNSINSNPSFSITSLFTVGSKYTKKQIKDQLRKYYEENNITKTPKASDIEEYYNLKTCKVKIDDKWENGFEIISLKNGDV